MHKEAFRQNARTTRNPYRARPFSIRSLLQSRIAPTGVLLWGFHLISGFSGRLGFGSGHHLPSIEGQLSAVYSFSVPMAGLGLDGSDADEPGGAELCSFAPWEVSMLPDEGFISPIGFASLAAPDAGGAELCSLAPVD